MDNKRELKTRKIIASVKGREIQFEEYYLVDAVTKEEVFDRNIEIENDLRLYDIYKKQTNLLTSSEIKVIRKRYEMNQKEFALALGLGEVTVHRFENGSIQTESVDSIIRLSEDPYIMKNLLFKNKNSFNKQEYSSLLKRVLLLVKLKEHRVATFNINDIIDLSFDTSDLKKVTNQLIIKYNKKIDDFSKKYKIKDMCGKAEYITPLKLQKLLYYIQGLSLKIYGKPAFYNDICAWEYGPVVKEIYEKYKGRNPISTPVHKYEISDGLNKVIDIVISSYGTIESEKLINLTHDEDPWINTKRNGVISFELIKDYFEKVYGND